MNIILHRIRKNKPDVFYCITLKVVNITD